MTSVIESKQLLASDPRVCAYVSASAGSGKTTLLVRRFLRLILSGENMGSILCVTFTNVAAAEILRRLERSLYAWFILNNEDLAAQIIQLTGETRLIDERLKVARSLYGEFCAIKPKLKVQTIHSFAFDVLQRANLLPSAHRSHTSDSILNPYTRRGLILRAFKDIIQDVETSLRSQVDILAKTYNYAYWVSLIEELFVQNAKTKYYFKSIKDLNDEALIHITYLKHGVKYKDTASGIIGRFIESARCSGHIKYIAEFLQEEAEKASDDMRNKVLDIIENMFCLLDNTDHQIRSFEKIAKLFITSSGTPCKNIKVIGNIASKNPVLAVQIKQLQEALCRAIKDLRNQKYASILSAFINVARSIYNRYEHFKSELGCLEYDDILLSILQLLQDSEIGCDVLYKLNEEISHILIDEAQDLSNLQWQIIKNLTAEFYTQLPAEGKRTILIVGDYKQSVFSFQGANPESFKGIYSYYKEQLKIVNRPLHFIELNYSFRSAQIILDYIDGICDTKHIAYDKEALGLVKKHIVILQKKECVDTDELNIKIDNQFSSSIVKKLAKLQWHERQEPLDPVIKLIVGNIVDWLAQRRCVHGTNKPLTANDIMILVRKRSIRLYGLVQELKKRNIEVADYTHNTDIYSHIIMRDLIAIAKFSLLPYDDLNLAILLKSPFIGLSDEDLLDLVHSREDYIWNILRNKSLPCAIHLFQYLSFAQHATSVYEFYSMILNNSHEIVEKYTKLYGVNSGDIIKLFLEKAFSFDEEHMLYLQSFIEWFETQGSFANQLGKVCSCSEKETGVKIMTIHGAKGLESPVVILADDLMKKEKPLGRHTMVLWQEEDDSRPDFIINMSKCSEYADHLKELYKGKNSREEARLLYVALTRARNELHFIKECNE